MSQQLQITGGAKVRDLQDVIIGTSGVLSSLAFNVANGVPKLDVNGKILVSQLPNSVMEYQGTWNAATNTPTLVNGTGNQGDVYLCNVAGTTNFGAGPITFAVGDSAIYSGTIWQRAGGATGTVTSVGLSTSGNAFTIGSSPVTTSGTITINGSGNSGQYINGAGNLTTFPTLISSIGLTMPSAFSVANSPLTSNGTIAVTGAGYPSQYIRGDGTLADFPTSGGGGSSVSYYLNGGTSQGTIGGVTYYEMSKTADTGTGVDFNKTGDGFIVAFLTDAGDPAQLNIPAGNWNYEIYASMSANGGTPEMYAELYKYDGTTFTLIATSPHEILYDGTALNLYTFAMTVPSTTLAITDRLAVKLYATNSGGKTTTVHTQDSHLCQIITTFSTGITALNGLTAQVQYFATGTSGTDFNISSATATHTFNLPVASASNTGKLSSTDWSTFNGKVPYTGATADVDLGIYGFSANLVAPKQIILKKDTILGGAISIETGSGFAWGGSNDTILLASGASNTLSLRSIVSSVLRTAILDFSTITASSSRTFTLPDASGTLALTSNLSSYVPYTGATTDLNLGLFNLYANQLNTQALDINTIGGGSAPINFYMSSVQKASIGASSSTLTFSAKNTNGFQFQNPSNAIIFSISNTGVLGNGTYSYTLPSATGTLALTSNITSAISGTTNYHAKFTGTNTIGNSLIWDNGTNVGIGNTNTSYTLDVSGTGRFTGNTIIGTRTTGNIRNLNIYGGTNNNAILKLDGADGNGYGAQVEFISKNSGGTSNQWTLGTGINTGSNTFELYNGTGVVMAATIGGNVGIGTFSPINKLSVYVSDATTYTSTSTGNILTLYNTSTTTNGYAGIDFISEPTSGNAGRAAINMIVTGSGTADLAFSTRNSTMGERMRITSGGVLLVGGTTAIIGGGAKTEIHQSGATTNLFLYNSNTSDTSNYFLWGNANGLDRILIYGNGNIVNRNNSYGPLSDIKLKENIVDATPKLNKLMQVRIVNYNLIGDELNQIGVIAQELEQVFPALVDEHSDRDKEGNDLGTTTKSVKMSVFVPILIKALQEQQIQIQNLQEQINILAK